MTADDRREHLAPLIDLYHSAPKGSIRRRLLKKIVLISSMSPAAGLVIVLLQLLLMCAASVACIYILAFMSSNLQQINDLLLTLYPNLP
jgi:hypothetical protein